MVKIKGWMINGCNPTKETQEEIWNDKARQVTVNKYTFLKGIDFANQIIIYDISETGAWKQLKTILEGNNIHG